MKIAIAGAGIGGLAAATFLSRSEHDVTLIDQFAAPQPVGSGLMLQATGLAVLNALGCLDDILHLGQPIDRLFGIASPSGRTVLDVRFEALRSSLTGLGIQRSTLFNTLLALAETSGCRFELAQPVIGYDVHSRKLELTTGADLGPFDLVIDAMGSRSPLTVPTAADLPYGAIWVTIEGTVPRPFVAASLEQRYRAARQMVGVMGSGRTLVDAPETATFFWSLRGDDYAAWRHQTIDDWKAQVYKLWPETEALLGGIVDHDQLTFARYRHRTHSRPIEGRLVRLGDSWHSTSPQLGQGANNALLDAYALTAALGRYQSTRSALKGYEWMRRPHVLAYQTMSWAFTPVYQSDGQIIPWMRDWLAAPLSRIPPAPQLLASIVSGGITAPLKRLGLPPVA